MIPIINIVCCERQSNSTKSVTSCVKGSKLNQQNLVIIKSCRYYVYKNGYLRCVCESPSGHIGDLFNDWFNSDLILVANQTI